MDLSIAGLIFAGLAAAYAGYVLWSVRTYGTIHGDDSPDVHLPNRPTALALAALGLILVIATIGCFAMGSDQTELAALAAWLWKF